MDAKITVVAAHIGHTVTGLYEAAAGFEPIGKGYIHITPQKSCHPGKRDGRAGYIRTSEPASDLVGPAHEV